MMVWKTLAGAAAMMGLMQPQIASAQDCVDQRDLSNAIIYAMPSMVSAVKSKCGTSLKADGFVKSGSAGMVSRYTAMQDQTWPGARRFALQMASVRAAKGAKGSDIAATIGSLPPEALRPFVDALILQEVSKVIPAKECSKIERGLSLMAPLPPENMGGLAAFLFEMAKVKNPSLCPYGAQ